MNKQLNRAIAHLEEKYGWIFRESQDPHNLKGECPLGWDIWYPTVGCSQFYGWDNSAFITHHVPEETIIWRAKSAGWTGEDWDPKEGEVIAIANAEDEMVIIRKCRVMDQIYVATEDIFPYTPEGLAMAKKKAGIQ